MMSACSGPEGNPENNSGNGAFDKASFSAERTQSTSNEEAHAQRGSDAALFGRETSRGQYNFDGLARVTPALAYPELIKALGWIKEATAQALVGTGAFDGLSLPNGITVSAEAVKDAIVLASREVASGKFNHQFVVNPIQGGAGTSLHMNANEIIANRANQILCDVHDIPGVFQACVYRPVHPNDHVNCAQSTNDVLPTAVRIAVLLKHAELRASLLELSDAFTTKSLEPAFQNTTKIGRTHLQDGVPMRASQEFQCFAYTLKTIVGNLDNVSAGLRNCTLGATAVGTGLNAPSGYADDVTKSLNEIMARTNPELHLDKAENYFATTSSLYGVVSYSAALRAGVVELNKIANDIRLLASGPAGGIGEITLPERQKGSSIMPGKINPVIPEMVNQVCYIVIGNDTTIGLCGQNGQLQLNVMGPTAVYKICESMELLTQALRKFKTLCVDGIELNSERAEDLAARSYICATALSKVVGYEASTKMALEQKRSSRTMLEVISDSKFMDSLGIQYNVEQLRERVLNLKDLT